MNLSSIFLTFLNIYLVVSSKCKLKCPESKDELVCGLNFEHLVYKMFRSDCAMKAYSLCNNKDFIPVSLSFCIKSQVSHTRKMYMESCPVFCPEHYRPVCGASKLRSYIYRTFTNGCNMDMINCRGHEDATYVEVPLKFCQNHMMKNIFKEQLVVTNLNYRKMLP